MYRFLLTMGMVISSVILVSGQSIPSYIPSSGLVGWWPFNGNANDESGNKNHGIVDGAKLSIDRFGRDLCCYKFNNNDITFPISNRQFINDFTISLWVKFENHVNEYPTFLWLENAGLVIQAEVLKDTTGFGCYFLDNFRIGGLQKEDGHVKAPSPLKQWNHIVLVNLNGINYLYINGILRATSNSKSILQGKQGANFLRLGKGFLSPLEDFNGLLDDLGIWNRALSADEVKRIFDYQLELTCIKDSLLIPGIPYGTLMDIDGNVYPTVTINNRQWMAMNLRTTRYSNGDVIQNIKAAKDWINMTSGAWCYYANDSIYNCPYGKLYNWLAITDHRNVCPSGWRVITLEDWGDLMTGVSNHKDWLNASVGWGPGLAYKNLSGMALLPGGMRGNSQGGAGEVNKFLGLNTVGWFGLPNKNPNGSAISLSDGSEFLTGANGYSYWNFFTSVAGTSVRCVQVKSSECDLIDLIQPGIISAVVGSSVKLKSKLHNPNTTFHWQAAGMNSDWLSLDFNNNVKYEEQKEEKNLSLTLKNINIGDNLLRLRLLASNGTCTDTSNIAVIIVGDTCVVTRYDTVRLAVKDTLLIEFLISNSTNKQFANSIQIYPNPASSQIMIDIGEFTLLSGFTLVISATNGSVLWNEKITKPLHTVDLTQLGAKGLYFFSLYDAQGRIVATRKIVLQ